MKQKAPKHEHMFILREKKVLLSKYRSEVGQIKYQATTGFDMLKQRVCACGHVETYGAVRTIT